MTATPLAAGVRDLKEECCRSFDTLAAYLLCDMDGRNAGAPEEREQPDLSLLLAHDREYGITDIV